MKLKKLFILVIIFFSIGCPRIFATENFEKIISIMNIPNKNINGYYINEEIYNKYSLMVYGTPEDITKNQRWKDVSTGRWINKTTGKAGEYRILGYNLTGNVVNNEVFPDDSTSGISPEYWNYISVPNALSSWNDVEKYHSKEQVEYMLSQNLIRNGITYPLSAQSIGQDKARIEAYATWKTAGSIFTLKKDSAGGIWEATFHVAPMAADAKFNAKLQLINGDKYKLSKEQDTLEIPIQFGAEVTNLGKYAKKQDIKNISAELEVENNIIDKVQSKSVISVLKENKLVINRADYPNASKVTLIIKNTSVLETCFQAEVPMVDIKEIPIEITFEGNELDEDDGKFIEVDNINTRNHNDIPRPSISGMKLYRKTINNKSKKTNLYIAKKTNTPFICAGQILVVEATVLNNPQIVTFSIEGNSKIRTLDELTKKFVYDEPRERGEKPMYSSLGDLKASYNMPVTMKKEDGVYKIEYVIPYGTKQSINSWSTLRNNNALEIDTSKLFTRITSPYVVKIFAKNSGGSITRSIEFDVFERWDTIYNRNITEYVK